MNRRDVRQSNPFARPTVSQLANEMVLAPDRAGEGGVPLSANIRATAVGLSGQAATFEEWEMVGRALKKIESGLQFAIGDWLLDGERRWGEKYTEAAALVGYKAKTLRQLVWVCRQVHLSLRIDKLTFGHHVLVAGMPADQQIMWLERAADATPSWSINRLRLEIARGERAPALDWYVDVALPKLDSFFKLIKGASNDERLELAAELRRRADWLEGKR